MVLFCDVWEVGLGGRGLGVPDMPDSPELSREARVGFEVPPPARCAWLWDIPLLTGRTGPVTTDTEALASLV